MDKIENTLDGRSVAEIVKDIRDYQYKENQTNETLLKMYIPENGVRKLSDINNTKNVVDVDAEVLQFIDNVDSKVMLIQGGAGTGKTIYCHWLIQ